MGGDGGFTISDLRFTADETARLAVAPTYPVRSGVFYEFFVFFRG